MKKENALTRTRIGCLCAALVMLVMLVMQFTPCWPMGEAGHASMSSYVWLPTSHSEVTDYVRQTLGSDAFRVDDVVPAAVLTLVFGVAGVMLCLVKPRLLVTPMLPMAAGLTGLVSVAAVEALRLCLHWQAYAVLSAMALAAGGVTLAWRIMDKRRGA